MSRTSRHGEVIRFLTEVDEQGVQRLLRVIRRADNRRLMERWGGLENGWEAVPSGRRAAREAAQTAARFRLRDPQIYYEPEGKHYMTVIDSESGAKQMYQRTGQGSLGEEIQPGEPVAGEWAEGFGYAKYADSDGLRTSCSETIGSDYLSYCVIPVTKPNQYCAKSVSVFGRTSG